MSTDARRRLAWLESQVPRAPTDLGGGTEMHFLDATDFPVPEGFEACPEHGPKCRVLVSRHPWSSVVRWILLEGEPFEAG
jgi:hypothetical protein